MHRKDRDIVKFWNKLKRNISRRGAISYNELGALDVKEFFVTLVNYEEEIKEEEKAHRKAMSRLKKPRR